MRGPRGPPRPGCFGDRLARGGVYSPSDPSSITGWFLRGRPRPLPGLGRVPGVAAGVSAARGLAPPGHIWWVPPERLRLVPAEPWASSCTNPPHICSVECAPAQKQHNTCQGRITLSVLRCKGKIRCDSFTKLRQATCVPALRRRSRPTKTETIDCSPF